MVKNSKFMQVTIIIISVIFGAIAIYALVKFDFVNASVVNVIRKILIPAAAAIACIIRNKLGNKK